MSDCVAKTQSGQVGGEAIAEGFRFLGVPYAAPPVGTHRFRPPTPVEPWDGIRPCLERAGSSNLSSNEDSLYLNVWTPALDDGRRPVMLWTSQPARFDGRRFARDDVVLITASTRPKAFASLCIEPLVALGSGNLAIYDQIAVLEWIKANITNFGGDPGNVTVFGSSHGGRSATSLTVSPLARGLVSKTIAMSTPRLRWVSNADARRIAAAELDMLGISPRNFDDLAEVPAERIVAVAQKVWGIRGPTQWVLDGVVLPAEPISLVAGGAAPGVDLMVGYTADEALYQLAPPADIRVKARRGDEEGLEGDERAWFAPTGLAFDDVLAAYAAEYPLYSRLELLATVATDHFREAADRLALAQLNYHPKVFMYRFDWKSPRDGGRFGAYHYLDTYFAFDTVDDESVFAPGTHKEVIGSPLPLAVASAYHGAFVRFAHRGDPNGGSLPDWPTYNDVDRPMMNFAESNHVITSLQEPLRRLWPKVALWQQAVS